MLTNDIESSRSHSHSPPPTKNDTMSLPTRFKEPNPHSTSSPETRLARLFLFLEAQFGEQHITPIPYPRNSSSLSPLDSSAAKSPTPVDTEKASAPFSVGGLPPAMDISAADKAELRRLHGLGIPVPGIEIRFDGHAARVWLEDLDVECKSKPLRDRIRAVMERAVETVSGLWI